MRTEHDVTEANYDETAREAAPLALRQEQEMAPHRQRAPIAPTRVAAAPAESRVRQTADVDALMMAFASAQMAFPVVTKDKTATIRDYSYKYADLADVQRAVYPILRENGLAFMFIPTRGVLVGRLIHQPTGQWIEGDLSIIPPDTRGGVQALGSALTYERRYLFAAMMGLTLDEDDDGATAQPPKPAARATPGARRNPPGGVPVELATFIRELAVEGVGARTVLVEQMEKNGEAKAVQEAALRLFDSLIKPPEGADQQPAA